MGRYYNLGPCDFCGRDCWEPLCGFDESGRLVCENCQLEPLPDVVNAQEILDNLLAEREARFDAGLGEGVEIDTWHEVQLWQEENKWWGFLIANLEGAPQPLIVKKFGPADYSWEVVEDARELLGYDVS